MQLKNVNLHIISSGHLQDRARLEYTEVGRSIARIQKYIVEKWMVGCGLKPSVSGLEQMRDV